MKTICKKWLIGLLVAALLCAVLPMGGLLSSAAAANLLTNGGFEDGLTDWKVGGTTALSDDAYAGEQSLLMGHSSAWGEALTRHVAVEKNTDYTLTFWVKRVTGGGAWNVYALNPSSFAALPVSEGNLWFSYSAKEWTSHTIVFNSGDLSQVMLKFCPESTGSGTFLIDEISLSVAGDEPIIPDTPDTPDTPDLPVATFTNGGFEQGAEGWTLGGATALSTDAHSGSQSVLLSHASAWGEALTRHVAVEKNTDYTLTFWVKRVSGGGAWNVYVLNPSSFAALPVTEGQMFFTYSAKEWVSHTIVFNSGDLSQVMLKFCPESTGSGTFLIDDISLTVKGEEPDTPDVPIVPAVGLTNGGFEKGEEGWKLGGNTVLSTEAHGGSQSMLLSHPNAYGEALLSTVGVAKNTDYVLTFWVKRVSGGGVWNVYALNPSSFAALPVVEGQMFFNYTNKEWVSHSLVINTGDLSEILLKFCPESAGAGEFLLDDVTLTVKGEEPDVPDEPVTPPAAPLTLSTYGVNNCRPSSEAKNLIIGGGFATAEGALWNVDTFLSDTVTVVEDASRADGYALYFNTSGTTKDEWHIFWVDVTPNTEYVFSAWLKGAFLSADNAARATIGVIDPDTQKYLVHRGTKFSTDQRQLVPPGWDNEWHLRSVSFHSGEKTRVGIALKGHGTRLWVDDISLHTADDGVKYASQRVYDSIQPNYNVDITTCKDEDNLVLDGHVNAANDFWQSGTGWKNGFLTVRDSEYEYGSALKYTEHEDSHGVHYIKWMDVEPGTEYTFSANVRVVSSGLGSLVLMDGKKHGTLPFLQVGFSQMIYGEEWFTVTCRFNTSTFSTIGIGVIDNGGEALIDNVRLFKTADAYAVEDAYVEPPYIPEEDMDSPATGVPNVALAVAALLPVSALTAFFFRKKRA